MLNSHLNRPDYNLDKPTSESVETAHKVQLYVVEPRTVLGYNLGVSCGFLYTVNWNWGSQEKKDTNVKFGLAIPSRSPQKLIFTQNRTILASTLAA